ncbi:hypothetical protein [Bradyrhizobium ottawaense]|uniref:hypothetical protein n=1 Tax=Bradyrhizobium ottawaense TaxID=931866 RepID=UPI003FA13D2D
MTLKQISRNLVSYHKRLPGKPASTPRSRLGKPISRSGLDPAVAKIIEASAETMVENDNNKRRRLVDFKDGCRYGSFGKTKTCELI